MDFICQCKCCTILGHRMGYSCNKHKSMVRQAKTAVDNNLNIPDSQKEKLKNDININFKSEACAICGLLGHNTSDCVNNPLCLNCMGLHDAIKSYKCLELQSKALPIYQYLHQFQVCRFNSM